MGKGLISNLLKKKDYGSDEDLEAAKPKETDKILGYEEPVVEKEEPLAQSETTKKKVVKTDTCSSSSEEDLCSLIPGRFLSGGTSRSRVGREHEE